MRRRRARPGQGAADGVADDRALRRRASDLAIVDDSDRSSTASACGASERQPSDARLTRRTPAGSERGGRRLEPPSRHASSTAVAIPRSWIASPVESKRVISSSSAASRRRPAQHLAELGHVLAGDLTPRDRARRAPRPPTPAPTRRRTGEQRASAVGLDLGLAVRVGPEHGEVLARAAGPRGQITGSLAGVTVTTTSCATASSRDPALASRARRRATRRPLRPRVEADPRPVARRRQAARRPGAVHTAADDARRPSRASARERDAPRRPPPRRSAARSPRRSP